MASFTSKFSLAFLITIACLVIDRCQSCERIHVPMCKGLVNYNFTRLPNKFGHTDQTAVYWELQQWWPFMDMGCSKNLRLMICGLYLPKCTSGSQKPQEPCRETCRLAKNGCSDEMRRQNLPWSAKFRCSQFLPKRSRKCLRPLKEKKKKATSQRHVTCQRNRLPICSDIPYRFGSRPNMFLQYNVAEMKKEIRQYQPLIDRNCSPYLKFFLCGVFMPFCLKQGEGRCDVPFVVPCREVCEQVAERCSSLFTNSTNGLPWPAKLHCHRYPSHTSVSSDECNVSCVMPS